MYRTPTHRTRVCLAFNHPWFLLDNLSVIRVNTKDGHQELVSLTNKGKRITALALNKTKVPNCRITKISNIVVFIRNW